MYIIYKTPPCRVFSFGQIANRLFTSVDHALYIDYRYQQDNISRIISFIYQLISSIHQIIDLALSQVFASHSHLPASLTFQQRALSCISTGCSHGLNLGPLDQQLFGASSTDQNPGQTADGKHLQVGSLWKLAQNKHYKFHQISLNMEVGKNRKKTTWG